MSGQLAFDLPGTEALGRADFFVSPANALVLAALDGWRGWPGAKMLLVGPAGAGKTHLAHIWAADAGAGLITGGDLAGADLPALAQTAVCVEDAESVAGDPIAEAALFHLHNMLAERGTPLLLTAATPPRDWGLGLPDLASRMQATPLTRLEAPDDALLSALLVKLFADRQISVPPNLIPWLVSRMDRSFAAARTLVAALDGRALALGKPVSRRLVADVMDSSGNAADTVIPTSQ